MKVPGIGIAQIGASRDVADVEQAARRTLPVEGEDHAMADTGGAT
jgi:hypothetical protein